MRLKMHCHVLLCSDAWCWGMYSNHVKQLWEVIMPNHFDDGHWLRHFKIIKIAFKMVSITLNRFLCSFLESMHILVFPSSIFKAISQNLHKSRWMEIGELWAIGEYCVLPKVVSCTRHSKIHIYVHLAHVYIEKQWKIYSIKHRMQPV